MNKLLLIINPVSGNKNYQKILPDIQNIFKKKFQLIETIQSEHKGHIEEIVKKYNYDAIDFICLIGGDGTFHEAINGMMSRTDNNKIPLGLIPCGSGNSLCRDLNLLNPLKAAKNISKQNKMSIDILKITDYNKNIVYSFNIVGWGMVANIGIKAEKYRWLGTSRYTLLSLAEIIFKKTYFANIIYFDKNNNKITDKDKKELMFIMIANTVHTGKGMKIAPNAKLNDGLVDMLLIQNVSRARLFKLMPKLFSGEHIKDHNVIYKQVKEIIFNSENKSKLNIDGEIKGISPFKLEIIPKALEIFS